MRMRSLDIARDDEKQNPHSLQEAKPPVHPLATDRGAGKGGLIAAKGDVGADAGMVDFEKSPVFSHSVRKTQSA